MEEFTRLGLLGFRTKPPEAKPDKNQTILVLGTPIQAVTDKKLYKVIKLRNGLTALLISDPEVTGEQRLAACALSVGVGSFSNPPNIQGMAHFVEHMVIMGSKKYPKPNTFSSFVTNHGGMHSAITNSETTTFFFEIGQSGLLQAMDIFSQFFVSPLMENRTMEHMLETIDSEFAMGAPFDNQRKQQLLASLLPKGNPGRTFACGNLRSLREGMKNDEEFYCEVRKFRRRHYSAHRMTLAVQASMDLSSLEEYVGQTFGQIPSNVLPPDNFRHFDYGYYGTDYITPEFNSLYYVKPVDDICELHLTWVLRSLNSETLYKPHHYESFLLGHEGQGSLFDFLKKRSWAVGISSDDMDNNFGYTSLYSLFTTRISLTKKGLDNLKEVMEAVFSYLMFLDSMMPDERIFNEMKWLANNRFLYGKTQPVSYVTSLAENMHLYQPEHYITGNRLYYELDIQDLAKFERKLAYKNLNIIVMSRNYTKPIQYDAEEKWYGTEYKREKIPEEWLDRWNYVNNYYEFFMPLSNVYITKNFNIIPPAAPYVQTAEKLGLNLYTSSDKDIRKKMAGKLVEDKTFRMGYFAHTIDLRLDQPNIFRKSKHTQMWYKPDFKWRLPKALLYFYFILPLSMITPRNMCLLDLWSDAVQHNIKEELYYAQMADLSFEMFTTDMGLMVMISGYNENLHKLVELTTNKMRSVFLKSEMFEAVRETRARHYHNQLIQPIALAEDILMSVLLEPYVSPRDRAAWVYNITRDEVHQFRFKKAFMLSLIQGNIPWYRASGIAMDVEADLQWAQIHYDEFPQIKVHQLPLGTRRIRVKSLNKLSTNSIVLNYYQGEVATIKKTVLLKTLVRMMEEAVCIILRREFDVGHDTFSMLRNLFNVLGFSITAKAQVDKLSVQHVEQAVDDFLGDFLNLLPHIRKSPPFVNKSIAWLDPMDYTLKDEAKRNWNEIISGEYNYQRRFEEDDAIKTLTLGEIKKWVVKNIGSSKQTRYRKLSVQIVGNDPNKVAAEPEPFQKTGIKLTFLNRNSNEKASEFITDIDGFKKDLPVMDVPKKNVQFD